MLIALTGTPGTGKSSVAAQLRTRGYEVADITKLAIERDFIMGVDKTRGSQLIDLEKIEHYIKMQYHSTDRVFLEGHTAHLIPSVEKVIILRCHPRMLKHRLVAKGWNLKKIQENLEAEILDVILCEAAERYPVEDLFEIDTTDRSVEAVISALIKIIEHEFQPIPKYSIGSIDWSEEIFNQ
jgi:adenylate kinase